MSEYIHEIAGEISPLLLAAEEANEASIVAICNLMAGAVAKRREIGILPASAQPAVLRLKRALDQTIDAQSHVLRFHGSMAEQYKTVAADDLHALTVENVQRSAETANRHRVSPQVVALRA